jgi:hypothetical protein
MIYNILRHNGPAVSRCDCGLPHIGMFLIYDT